MSWFSAKRPRAQFEPVPTIGVITNTTKRFKVNNKPTVNVSYTRSNYRVKPNPLVNNTFKVSLKKQGSFFKANKTRKRKTRRS